jgi:hypothetical protein
VAVVILKRPFLTAKSAFPLRGLNDSRPGHLLGLDETPRGINALTDEVVGAIWKRPGWALMGSLPSGLPCKSGFRFVTASGVEYLLITDGVTLYSTRDAVTLAMLKTGLNAAFFLEFCAVRDKVWCSNGSNAVFTVNFTTDPPTVTVLDGTSGTPNVPKGLYPMYFMDRVWMWSTTQNRSIGYFSALVNSAGTEIAPDSGPDAWPPTNAIYANREDGDAIYGSGILGRMYVFKGNSIYYLTGTDELVNQFALIRTPSDHGTQWHRSIAVRDNLLHYLGADGVYVFDGSRSKRISDKIVNVVAGITQPSAHTLSKIWESQADFDAGAKVQTKSYDTGELKLDDQLADADLTTDWDVQYEANELPDAATPPWVAFDNGANDHIDDGKLHIETPNAPAGMSYYMDGIDADYDHTLAALIKFGRDPGTVLFGHSIFWRLELTVSNGYKQANLTFRGHTVPWGGGGAPPYLQPMQIDLTVAGNLLTLPAGMTLDLVEQEFRLVLHGAVAKVYANHVWMDTGGGVWGYVDNVFIGQVTSGVNASYKEVRFGFNVDLRSPNPDSPTIAWIDFVRYDAKALSYYAAGSWESAAYDKGDVTSDWGALDADYTLNGETLTFKYRTATTSGGLVAASYTTVTPGSYIVAVAANRWIQVKAEFATAHPAVTPILDSFSVAWSAGSVAVPVAGYAFDGRYYLALQEIGSSYNNIIMVFQRKSNAAWQKWTGINAAWISEFAGGLIFGSANAANLGKLLTGTSDNGVAINFRWESRDETFDNGLGLDLRYWDWRLEFRGQTVGTLAVSYSKDYGATFSAGIIVDLIGVGRCKIDRAIVDQGKAFRLRLINNTTTDDVLIYCYEQRGKIIRRDDFTS